MLNVAYIARDVGVAHSTVNDTSISSRTHCSAGIWRRDNRAAGIKIESSSACKSSINKGLNILPEAGEIEQAFGVYQGERTQKHGEVSLLPWPTAIKMAADGKLLC